MNQNVLTEIQGFIVGYIRDQVGNEERFADPDFNYVDSGVLDSFSILNLILTLESEYGIKFKPPELTDQSVYTVGGLADAVLRKLNQ